MNRIASIDAGLYRIALPVTLTDSTHGAMTHFELVTAPVVDGDAAQGVGYTYTVGSNGRAIHATITHDLAPERPGHGIVFDWGGLEALRS